MGASSTMLAPATAPPSVTPVEQVLPELPPEDDSFINPLACAVCWSSKSQPVKQTACGHRFCERCLLKYCETRRRGAQPITCPVCRQVLKQSDLPKAFHQVPVAPPPVASANGARTPHPSDEPAVDECMVLASCCCCCVVVGQIHEAAVRRPRAWRGVAGSLFLVFLLALVPEGIGSALDASGIADAGNATFQFIHFNHALELRQRRAAFSDGYFTFGFVLRTLSLLVFLVLWIAAAREVGRSRAVLRSRERFMIAQEDDFSCCCVPCAVLQVLSALGITGSRYSLCSPLPVDATRPMRQAAVAV